MNSTVLALCMMVFWLGVCAIVGAIYKQPANVSLALLAMLACIGAAIGKWTDNESEEKK